MNHLAHQHLLIRMKLGRGHRSDATPRPVIQPHVGVVSVPHGVVKTAGSSSQLYSFLSEPGLAGLADASDESLADGFQDNGALVQIDANEVAELGDSGRVHDKSPSVGGQGERSVGHEHVRFWQPLYGFTLIELLVVISVIAILISLLLPALRSARNSALAVVCASNLRQSGIGFQIYGDDYGDQLPPALIGSMTSGDWHRLISPYLNREKSDRLGLDYLSCPVEVGSYNGQFVPWHAWGSAGSYGVNYAGNGSKPFGYWRTENGPEDGQGSQKITDVAPSEFLAADAALPYIYNPDWLAFNFDMDSDGVLDTSQAMSGPWLYNQWEPRHAGSANMLFIDGSVRRIQLNDWLKGENNLW